MAAVIIKKIKSQQCYLQAARCLNSERSWCYSRHCRYSWPLRGTEGADVMFRFLYSVTVHSCFLMLVSPESSWRPLCRPSAGLNAPDRWTPLQTASPQSTPAGLSSSGRGRCRWLSAERGEEASRLWRQSTEFVSFTAALSINTVPSSA